jgi:hypothetical protein
MAPDHLAYYASPGVFTTFGDFGAQVDALPQATIDAARTADLAGPVSGNPISVP